ncbi:MAG: hypothetical protein LBD51_02160 [Bifidobacteriaceae bacterium]|jgi:hypothetical protein|nr:hypothetical protein [Bifidobacteriaceae bacterium]
MKRFAKALVDLVSSAARAGSVLMERGAQRLTEYADQQADPPQPPPPPPSS